MNLTQSPVANSRGAGPARALAQALKTTLGIQLRKSHHSRGRIMRLRKTLSCLFLSSLACALAPAAFAETELLVLSEDVPVGGVLRARLDGQEVVLYHLEDGWYATEGHCTHRRARLATGHLEGGIIVCPLHFGKFDIRTGEVRSPPCTENLRTFPVRRENDVLLVGMPA